MTPYYLGIDVGTGSARAAIIDSSGTICGLAINDIQLWNPRANYYEQSSEDIWSSVCLAAKAAMAQSGLKPANIKGVGFDGTCSLVVLDRSGKPISIDPESSDGENHRNIILWADHRAGKQADKINATDHEVLKYVGGKVSVEMELPKILWIKENLQERWNKIGSFFDLPDFLTYRATGNASRSICSLACKCGYVPPDTSVSPQQGWHDDFFQSIGLAEFINENYSRMSTSQIFSAGQKVAGLSQYAANELGLLEGTPVSSGLIDAYAGIVGTLAAKIPGECGNILMEQRLAVIAGTSSCHILMINRPLFVDGVWGPYRDALLRGHWLNEGGQSATGKLIDWIIDTHPFSIQAKTLADEKGISIYDLLNEHINTLQKRQNLPFSSKLTKDLHVYPDFHGNRSPLSDPTLCGAIVGLTLDVSLDALALLYYSTLQSIGYGTRHIIEAMNNSGHNIKYLYMSGGLCKNELFVKTMADATKCPVVLPKYVEASVVIGAAICGASASEAMPIDGDKRTTLWDFMERMNGTGQIVATTAISDEIEYNERKYMVYLNMWKDQIHYRHIIEGKN
ncbi:8421_t:CDS:2 [Paraglomus occultum]|uniref:8421_t:CDS:1 n=1 Tax=Paraglomus occultum TaxID=144539 RepID=A0A9N8WEY5_9GLOM|nr:8421_t:CDS:2 [Paraglomus occultum]